MISTLLDTAIHVDVVIDPTHGVAPAEGLQEFLWAFGKT